MSKPQTDLYIGYAEIMMIETLYVNYIKECFSGKLVNALRSV